MHHIGWSRAYLPSTGDTHYTQPLNVYFRIFLTKILGSPSKKHLINNRKLQFSHCSKRPQNWKDDKYYYTQACYIKLVKLRGLSFSHTDLICTALWYAQSNPGVYVSLSRNAFIHESLIQQSPLSRSSLLYLHDSYLIMVNDLDVITFNETSSLRRR